MELGGKSHCSILECWTLPSAMLLGPGRAERPEHKTPGNYAPGTFLCELEPIRPTKSLGQ